MIEKIYIALGAAAIIGLFGLVGSMDYEDQVNQMNAYCDMRLIYELDKARGVPENDRRGWPDFKPEVSCEVQNDR